MKTRQVMFVVIGSLTIMSGCADKATSPQKVHVVTGKIISGGSPVANATASLDRRLDLTAATDSSGAFSISNVPEGNYALILEKVNANGSFLFDSSKLVVLGDLSLSALMLPKAITLQSLINVTSASITLSWNATDGNDFREYKLYRHLTSGLDEVSGTLVHVATSISDT